MEQATGGLIGPSTLFDSNDRFACQNRFAPPAEFQPSSCPRIVQSKTKSCGKPWETLATLGPIPRHLGIPEAVVRFCLTTGHDFLGVYLHWLGVAVNEAWPLCGHARMDGDHLLQYTGLVEYPAVDIVSSHWEAWRQMVKKPSTGVG
ncbi:reverse transcriptase [Trichonephila clavipes]|nr:reverse transcriptase [Trichonephila clavipes]